jgi:DNA-directed RNA polymerase beta subunit
VRTSHACKYRTQAAAAFQPDSTSPDNTRVWLNYPQNSLVGNALDCASDDTLAICASQTVLVAIMSDARTTDDGVLLNLSSVERGLFNITREQDFHAQARPHHEIMVPDMTKTIGVKQANYAKLDLQTGIVKPGSQVEFNDVLIGIVCDKDGVLEDKSVVYTKHVPAKVSRISHSSNRYGVENCTVTLVQTCNTMPSVGDKLASTHSQKGVVVGLVPSYDMPVVAEGECMGMPVDMVFNPHGFTTRMTCATITEGALGMFAAKFGKKVNASVFEKMPDLTQQEYVRQFGSSKMRLMNGQTGELYENTVMVALASYFRVDRLVKDSVQIRDGGPVDEYHQPKAGKAQNGGLRVGVMEKGAIDGHGAAELMNERLCTMSDGSQVSVCTNTLCSDINGDPPDHTGLGLCRLCNTRSCVTVKLPYSTACFVNHLHAVGLKFTYKLVADKSIQVVLDEPSQPHLPHLPNQPNQPGQPDQPTQDAWTSESETEWWE